LHLKKYNDIKPKSRNGFFSYRNEDKLDDHTFKMWKSELEKELPSFWESVSNNKFR